MRVVLDTNVLARALPGRSNAAELVLFQLLTPPHVLVASDFILNELARVVRYPRLQRIHGLSSDALNEYIERLRAAAEVIPGPAVGVEAVVVADPEDDPIVATAVLGRAEALVTWDRHLRGADVRSYLRRHGVRVVREQELLQQLRA